jgi:hypothetical protein
MLRNFCFVAAAAACLAVPSSAFAYWPYFGYGGFGYGYGGGNLGFGYTTNYVPAPPYYSIYPPVYYSSQITARHYGASPFAWYPGMEPITYVPQPEPVASSSPAVIENPYVRSSRPANNPPAAAATSVEQLSTVRHELETAPAVATQTQVAAQAISNPFFTSER